MPNLWEDLSNTHGLSEHWNRFVRLKNEFSSKHCGTCGSTGAQCCIKDQMIYLLPKDIKPRTCPSRSVIRNKCSMLMGNRCFAENFKPIVCITHFCDRLKKTFTDKDTRFIRKFMSVLYALPSLYSESTDGSPRLIGWGFLLRTYLERHPEEHSRFMRHIVDVLSIEIAYPPVIQEVPSLVFQRIGELTTCSMPETGTEPYIPLWRI